MSMPLSSVKYSILGLLSDGTPRYAAEIAAALGVSVPCVQKHVPGLIQSWQVIAARRLADGRSRKYFALAACAGALNAMEDGDWEAPRKATVINAKAIAYASSVFAWGARPLPTP